MLRVPLKLHKATRRCLPIQVLLALHDVVDWLVDLAVCAPEDDGVLA